MRSFTCLEKRRSSTCVGCGSPITDQYILRVSPDLEWHAACLKCADCHQFLDETCTCFVRDGKTYCKRDYFRWVSNTVFPAAWHLHHWWSPAQFAPTTYIKPSSLYLHEICSYNGISILPSFNFHQNFIKHSLKPAKNWGYLGDLQNCRSLSRCFVCLC